ncbi:MAG TPA: hypothetical protein VF472_22385 [Burkholderiaceae bacterium]
MDFSHEQGFNAQKAGGIGAVVLAHIILGAALVYCLHSTIIRVEHKGPIVVEPEAPTLKKPNEPVKFDTEPSKHMATIDLPPVEKVPEHTPYVAPQTEPLEQPSGSGNMTREGGIDGDGPGVKPAGHTSNHVIADLNECKPEYPAAAIREEEEGTVRLKLDIGANG